jgi:hypothetical protein
MKIIDILLPLLFVQDKFHSFHPVATILSYLSKAPLVSFSFCLQLIQFFVIMFILASKNGVSKNLESKHHDCFCCLLMHVIKWFILGTEKVGKAIVKYENVCWEVSLAQPVG